MLSLERVKSALESFVHGSASAEERETVRAAVESGQVTLATGERAIAVGGDASGAAFVTGDNNVLLTVSATTAQAVKQAIASLVRPSPNQLPADLSDFQGREDQIERLKTILTGGGTAAVTAIGGMGGVGKSALALHVAHELADVAPDGRIFVDLGGTSSQPLTPLAAMITVIQALQPEAQAPTELGPAERLYRSCLDGKRVLLLFDNAANSAQVAPLVEWRAATTLVIVTARQDITASGLKNIRLDVMEPGEALDLLRVALTSRSANDAELNALSERCGKLPLALRVAGTFLALNRDWSVTEYIKALKDQKQRLAWLKIEDDARLDVHAVLGLSARKLTEEKPDLARRWQMLAVFPASFDRAAAAAIWSVTEDEVRKGLSYLLQRSMVMYDEADGRYRLHDLMRDVARLPLEGEDQATVEGRLEEATSRHAQHYWRVLEAANEQYLRDGGSVLTGLALYDLEQRNILAGQAWAVEHMQITNDAARLAADYLVGAGSVLLLRLPAPVRLGWGHSAMAGARQVKDKQRAARAASHLGSAYQALGHVRHAIKWHERCLSFEREIGDRHGEGGTLNNLGHAYYSLGEPRRAIEHYMQSLAIAREIGDRHGEGLALGNLGNAYCGLGELRRAIEYYKEVLKFLREVGDRHNEGGTLGNLGNAYYSLGEPRRALQHHEQHLAIAREIGDRQGEGLALGNLGNAYNSLGESRRAIEHYEQRLAIARELGDRHGEGQALGNLGHTYYSLGEPRRAIEHYEQHLAIAREIGDRHGEGGTLYGSAVVLHQLGKRDEAITRMKQALQIYEQIESPWQENARARLAEWQAEGQALANLGLAHAAIERYEQDLAMARESSNRRDQGTALHSLGNAYADLGELRRAIEYYEQGLEIAREIGDRRSEGVSLGALGKAYANLGEGQQAIRCFQQALAIAREIGDRGDEVISLGYLGGAHGNVGEMQQAIQYFEQALAIAREIGDQLGESHALFSVAVAFNQLGERVEAIRRMDEALRIYEQIKDPKAEWARAWLAEWRREGGA